MSKKQGSKYQQIAKVSARSYKATGLKKATNYKYIVVAVQGDKAVAISKNIHVITTGHNKRKRTQIRFLV